MSNEQILAGPSLYENVTGLLGDVTALVKSDTAKAIPEIAEALGIMDKVDDALDFLIGLATDITGQIEKLKELLLYVDAVGGTVDLLDPLFRAVVDLVEYSSEGLENLGLSELMAVSSGVKKAAGAIRHFLDLAPKALDLLPTREEFASLEAAMTELVLSLKDYKRLIHV